MTNPLEKCLDPKYFTKLPHATSEKLSKVWYFPQLDEVYAIEDFEKSAMSYFLDSLENGESIELSDNASNGFVHKVGAIGIQCLEKVTVVWTDLSCDAVMEFLKKLLIRYPMLITDEISLEIVGVEY